MSVNPFSINWWMNTLVQAFVIMVMFYIIKSVTAKVNIPFVSDIAAAA